MTPPSASPVGGPPLQVSLLLEQALAPSAGGTGRYTLELAAALVRSGHVAVTGYTAWHRDVTAARVAGVAGPRRLPLGRRALPLAWERGLGRPLPGDLVHAPTPLAPPRGRRPLVVTVHDAVPWTHPETLSVRGVAWHRTAITRAAATADAIIVPSAATAAALAAHVALRHNPVVVPMAATPMPVPADAAARRARLGLTGPYLLTVATLEPRKGLDVLVAALADPAAPDLPLVVAGDPGWGGQDLTALAEAAGLPAGRVRAVGRLAGADLAAVYAGASALAVPSRAEGFGLPVLEGLAAGVPVVVSDDPALLETGGDAVTVAPRGDAAALARALAGALGRDPGPGRRRAAGFTWDRTAAATLAVYAAVV